MNTSFQLTALNNPSTKPTFTLKDKTFSITLPKPPHYAFAGVSTRGIRTSRKTSQRPVLTLDAQDGTEVKQFVDQVVQKQVEVCTEYEREIRTALGIKPADALDPQAVFQLTPDLPFRIYEDGGQVFSLFPSIEFTQGFQVAGTADGTLDTQAVKEAKSVRLSSLLDTTESCRFLCEVVATCVLFTYHESENQVKSKVWFNVRKLYAAKDKQIQERETSEALAAWFKRKEQ